jgi:hypothetical protein
MEKVIGSARRSKTKSFLLSLPVIVDIGPQTGVQASYCGVSRILIFAGYFKPTQASSTSLKKWN